MKKIMFSVVCVLLFCCSTANAGGWSNPTNIKTIYPLNGNNPGGTIYFAFDEVFNPDGCANSNLSGLLKSNGLLNEIYSLMMMAATTKQKVQFYASGCDAAGFVVISHVQMHIN